jgi:hypothetical protein
MKEDLVEDVKKLKMHQKQLAGAVKETLSAKSVQDQDAFSMDVLDGAAQAFGILSNDQSVFRGFGEKQEDTADDDIDFAKILIHGAVNSPDTKIASYAKKLLREIQQSYADQPSNPIHAHANNFWMSAGQSDRMHYLAEALEVGVVDKKHAEDALMMTARHLLTSQDEDQYDATGRRTIHPDRKIQDVLSSEVQLEKIGVSQENRRKLAQLLMWKLDFGDRGLNAITEDSRLEWQFRQVATEVALADPGVLPLVRMAEFVFSEQVDELFSSYDSKVKKDPAFSPMLGDFEPLNRSVQALKAMRGVLYPIAKDRGLVALPQRAQTSPHPQQQHQPQPQPQQM